MANKKSYACVRFVGALVIACCGLWAAGLPVGVFGVSAAAALAGPFGPAPNPKAEATPHLKTISAKALGRITTITIACPFPVAYLTARPAPMPLLGDLREVDGRPVAKATLEAKGALAGASVEEAIAADGARVARVRIRLTQ